MAGYDRDKIVGVNEEQLDELICGICHGVLNDPVATECCQQSYCSVCINQWLVRQNTCPNDRKTLTEDSLKPVPISFRNLIETIKTKCNYSSEGCPVEVPIGELDQHILECDFGPNTQCLVCGLPKEKKSPIPHSCIESLLSKIKIIEDENKRMKSERNVMVNFMVEDQNEKMTQMKQIFTDMVDKIIEDNRIFKSQLAKVDGFDIESTLIRMARNDLDNFSVVESFQLCSETQDLVVEACKEAIRQRNRFSEVAETTIELLKAHDKFNTDKLHVRVGEAGKMQSGFECNFCLHVQWKRLSVLIVGCT